MNIKLSQFMSFRKNGKKIIPLFVSSVNEKFIIAVYQGTLSKFDILIKYRQRDAKSSIFQARAQ